MKYSFAVLAFIGAVDVNAITLKSSMDLERMTEQADNVLMQYEGEPHHYATKLHRQDKKDSKKESKILSQDEDDEPDAKNAVNFI